MSRNINAARMKVRPIKSGAWKITLLLEVYQFRACHFPNSMIVRYTLAITQLQHMLFR
jgi:hypothetical protein